jgi:hypothetical protein
MGYDLLAIAQTGKLLNSAYTCYQSFHGH